MAGESTGERLALQLRQIQCGLVGITVSSTPSYDDGVSLVTNLMVTTSVLEPRANRAALRAWRQPTYEARNVGLGDISGFDQAGDETEDHAQFWGGTKFPECPVYAGAFNYLDLDEFLKSLAQIPWKHPADVQVFVRGQEDERFSVYELGTDGFALVLDRRD